MSFVLLSRSCTRGSVSCTHGSSLGIIADKTGRPTSCGAQRRLAGVVGFALPVFQPRWPTSRRCWRTFIGGSPSSQTALKSYEERCVMQRPANTVGCCCGHSCAPWVGLLQIVMCKGTGPSVQCEETGSGVRGGPGSRTLPHTLPHAHWV